MAVKNSLHLFDTLVKPILLYSCETWGAFMNKKQFFNLNVEDTKVFDKFYFESVNIKFCKFISGCTSNGNKQCYKR